MSSAIEIDDRYKNGKIYKIVDRINENIYIGSTIKTLNKRLSEHKCYYKRKENGKCNSYSYTSFEIIENDDFYIELIEEYPCNNRYELELQERFHIETNICLNKKIPNRTREEWREYHKQYNKQYHLDNLETIKEQKKQYNLNNLENIKEKKKQHYNKNREEINEKRKVKVRCDICKYEVRKDNMNKHIKTKKHHKNLARIQGRTILFNNNC